MTNYIDGFVFPIRRIYLDDYKKVAEQVAEIWKAYGATAYFEWVGDDLFLEGTRSFVEALNVKDDEAIIFGWVVFPSKAIRESANKKVPLDPRMTALVGPLVNPERLIFDASRMVYGGFQPLIQSNE
ncbi:DUF1428 domain-containing protein [Winogradskyella sp.]|uniref:DUF1428 domain-containing protein n=1 Tax=Winogradskyella sp. TaxID=1883156 RepID=UPI003BA898D6